MKQMLTGVTFCVILVLCLSNPVSAALINQWYGGDRVVYDTFSGIHWYPYLTDTVSMTRAQQSSYIACLNAHSYGNSQDWDFATYKQTHGLKDFLASKGKRVGHERPWTLAGTPRKDGSLFLAWPIQNEHMTRKVWRTNVPGTPPTWKSWQVDDHFVVGK
ncbi:MAG: hypothetical protein JSW47_12785, partial [Phycisphaerales bacterium]